MERANQAAAPLSAAQSRRLDEIVADFSRSAELAELGLDAPRYVAALLDMTAQFGWDIADVSGERLFLAAAARLVLEQLPLWSQCTSAHEVPSMTAELRAFFRFGRRTERISHAADWLELVASDDIDEVLGSFLRTRHWPALAPAI